MVTLSKKLVTPLLLLSVIALCFLAGKLYFELRETQQAAAKLKAQRESVKAAIAVDAEIISQRVDKDSLRHATISENDNVYTPADLKDTESILDTTALAIGILKKQIVEFTRIATIARANELKAYALLDSQKRLTFAYRDRWLSLAYRPPVNTADTADHGEFDFAYNSELNITQYGKRNWFLGEKKGYIDIYSADPRNTVNGVKRLRVAQNKSQFGLRLQVAGEYRLDQRKIMAGAALRMDAGRFGFEAKQLYSPEDFKQRQTVFGATYDVYRF